MKYFIDFEFIEGFKKPLFGKRRHFIDLISVGIVAEDGREYYAISNEFNPKDANDWVNDNVISKLPSRFLVPDTRLNSPFSLSKMAYWKNNAMIANDIQGFVYGGGVGVEHEFYGYYADYDWVLLCSLFGTMMELPKGFPMYCRDLKQMLDERGTSLKDDPDYPKQEEEHDALADARWNKQLYSFLNQAQLNMDIL
jgi:hypothetical protein